MSIEFSVVFMRGYSFGQDMAQSDFPCAEREKHTLRSVGKVQTSIMRAGLL